MAAARGDLDARGILVVAHLDASNAPDGHDELVESALTTLFRALPARLSRGSVLYVATRDRSGGDVEVMWEALEDPEATGVAGAADAPRDLLAQGPYGDLATLALSALENACRARSGFVEEQAEPINSSSAFAAPRAVRRRVSALIPRARQRSV